MKTYYTPALNPTCVSCLVKKQIDRYPSDAPPALVLTYMRRLGDMMAHLPDRTGGPAMMEQITRLQEELFGRAVDYTPIKRHFNALMLSQYGRMETAVMAYPQPLVAALGYAMTGNYIDFGAMDTVDEEKLSSLLDAAPQRGEAVDRAVLDDMIADLSAARTLCYLIDNCGEIVCDKLMIRTIRALYPRLSITVLVRGAPVLNDATWEDAEQVGLTRMDGVTVIPNGDTLAGTALDRISSEARHALESADLIIAKGQGNFETMQGCGLNVYYAFLCKCRLFADRFGVPLLSGMLVRDRQLLIE